MQLVCKLVPPPTLTAHPKNNVTFSKTRPGCPQANLVSTMGLTWCESPPPPPPLHPLKNPSYAPVPELEYDLHFDKVNGRSNLNRD